MNLNEIFENAVSVKKTVWSKRGDKISHREIQHRLITDVHPRTEIVTKEKNDDART